MVGGPRPGVLSMRLPAAPRLRGRARPARRGAAGADRAAHARRRRDPDHARPGPDPTWCCTSGRAGAPSAPRSCRASRVAAQGCDPARVRVIAVNVGEDAGAGARVSSRSTRSRCPVLLDPGGKAWRRAGLWGVPSNLLWTARGRAHERGADEREALARAARATSAAPRARADAGAVSARSLVRIDDLERPRLPLRAARRSTRPAGRSPRAIRLDEAGLLAAARRRTGLSDFGDPAFREPLRVLLAALRARGGPHPDRSLRSRAAWCVQLLVTRLRVEALRARAPGDPRRGGARADRDPGAPAHRHHAPAQSDVAGSGAALAPLLGVARADPGRARSAPIPRSRIRASAAARRACASCTG